MQSILFFSDLQKLKNAHILNSKKVCIKELSSFPGVILLLGMLNVRLPDSFSDNGHLVSIPCFLFLAISCEGC